MTPVILVGLRAGDPRRDRLWDYCCSRWLRTLPAWPLIPGHHGSPFGQPDDHELFCLSVAFNRAAALADATEPEWDVALVVGGDWIAGTPGQCEAAAALALDTELLVFAHDRTLVLNEAVSDVMLEHGSDEPLPPAPPSGIPLPFEDSAGSWHANTFSGILAVPRELWREVGGFDERFVGWGFDDLAFLDACSALRGGYERVAGAIAHLWHPQDRSQREEGPTHGSNQVLWERYRSVRSDKNGMLALLHEPTRPRNG